MRWKEVFEGQSLFRLPLGQEHVRRTMWLTPKALFERYATLSYVAVLDGKGKEVKSRGAKLPRRLMFCRVSEKRSCSF